MVTIKRAELISTNGVEPICHVPAWRFEIIGTQVFDLRPSDFTIRIDNLLPRGCYLVRYTVTERQLLDVIVVSVTYPL